MDRVLLLLRPIQAAEDKLPMCVLYHADRMLLLDVLDYAAMLFYCLLVEDGMVGTVEYEAPARAQAGDFAGVWERGVNPMLAPCEFALYPGRWRIRLVRQKKKH
jgi:hypothetical protein